MIQKGLLKEFQKTVGAANVFTDQTDLQTYSYDIAVLTFRLPSSDRNLC